MVGDRTIMGMGGTELLSILAKLLPSKAVGIHTVVGMADVGPSSIVAE